MSFFIASPSGIQRQVGYGASFLRIRASAISPCRDEPLAIGVALRLQVRTELHRCLVLMVARQSLDAVDLKAVLIHPEREVVVAEPAGIARIEQRKACLG